MASPTVPEQTGQIPLNLKPSRPQTFDYFVETPANRDALKAVRAWPNWPGAILRLYGPAGSGKTHLGQAWAAGSEGVFIDDAHDVDEAELFHAINRALADPGAGEGTIKGAGLLLASEVAPKDWGVQMPDLISRLGAIPETVLREPDDESLEPIVRALFAQQGREIRRDVVDYMLKYSDRSIQALHGLVLALEAQAQEEKRDITKAFAVKFIKSL